MTCRSRSLRSGVAILLATLAVPAAVSAADLPAIKTSDTNRVPECVTPGRLQAYVRERNPNLDERYGSLASEYMSHGQTLQIRWDYAFFQMLLETGYLTYKGDVRAEQNNFAGLGATGRGARGESFKDISTGVRAHLEHLLMYSGTRVENPTAERTRNIQDWGVLTSWQQGLSGPITFAQAANKWAPGSRRYVSDVDTIANRFFDGLCKQADPQPDVVAAVQPSASAAQPKADAAVKTTEKAPEAEKASVSPGLEAQRRAIEAAKTEGGGSVRAALGAPLPQADAPVKPAATNVTAQASATTPPLTLLNGQPPAAESKPAEPESAKAIEVAALPSAAATGVGKAADQKPSAAGKCRVWTASYGGGKAIIIKAVLDATTNYTVLDVNEGAEKREADAYINAYAKGGQPIGEFSTQAQALDKAFELCPEG
jgi:hypothetical protein